MLMMIGGASGSTAGGVKLGTAVLVIMTLISVVFLTITDFVGEKKHNMYFLKHRQTKADVQACPLSYAFFSV